jgi:hypothetical protein
MEGTLVWGEIASTPAVRTDVRPDRQAIVAFANGADGGLLLVGEGGVRRVEVPR